MKHEILIQSAHTKQLPMLRNTCVKDNREFSTDFSVTLVTQTHKEDGVYFGKKKTNIPLEEFPMLDFGNKAFEFNLDNDFFTLLKSAAQFCSKEEDWGGLLSVCMDFNNKKIVASDAHFLFLHSYNFPNLPIKMFNNNQLLIDHEDVDKLSKIAGKDIPSKLAIYEKYIEFIFRDYSVFIFVSLARFVDYMAILPTYFEKIIEFNRKDILAKINVILKQLKTRKKLQSHPIFINNNQIFTSEEQLVFNEQINITEIAFKEVPENFILLMPITSSRIERPDNTHVFDIIRLQKILNLLKTEKTKMYFQGFTKVYLFES